MSAQTRQFPNWVHKYFPLAVLVIPLLILAIFADLLDSVLFERVVIIMFVNMIMVLGLQSYMGNSGVASFGHVGFMLMGAYGSIIFTMTSQQKTFTLPDMPQEWLLHSISMPFVPAILVTVVIVAAMGGLIGLVLLRIGPTAAGFTSFALLIVIRIIALSFDPLTRGTRTVVGISRLTTLWTATIWALFFVIVTYLFKESALGLRLRASREDDRAAENFGINLLWVRWVAWVLSIALTVVGGALWAHFVTVFSPHGFWIPVTFLILTMLVIGGQASVAGAVVGTLAVTIVSESLRTLEYTINIQRQSDPFFQNLFPKQVVGLSSFFLAIALLLILTMRPSGIMKGREFRWPFGSLPMPESSTRGSDGTGTVPTDSS